MDVIWLVALLSLAVTAAVVVLLPRWLVPVGLSSGEVDRRKLQLDVVRGCAEVLGGAFFLVTILLGWQQVRLSQQSQITDRYTQAIEQLGSSEVTVRTGGIYALESISQDSPDKQKVVMEVLASFLRENSPATGTPAERDWMASRSRKPASDIVAAAVVIGRRNRDAGPESERPCNRLGGENFPCALDLERVDLSSINLTNLNFDQMNLRGAVLNNTNAAFASFRNADMSGSDLRIANFRLANFTGTRINFSFLTHTNLHLTVGLTCDQLNSAQAHGRDAANLTISC